MARTYDRQSESTSNIASVTAVSEPAFPTVYRREKGATAFEQHGQRDGSVSFVSAPVGETLLSQERQPEKGPDRLAPMPENRRLGYLSVAALIINKMIGMPS